MAGPTPDFNTVTVVWDGNLADGGIPEGTLSVEWLGGVRTDPDATTPRSVLPVPHTAAITAVSGHGHAEIVDLPASNDPDITYAPGSRNYRATLTFTNSTVRSISVDFFADVDAPGGIIDLAAVIAAGGTSGSDAGAVSVVTVAQFNALDDRVTTLEGTTGVGTVTSVNEVDPISGDVTITAALVPSDGASTVQDDLDALTAGLAAKASTSDLATLDSAVDGLAASIGAKADASTVDAALLLKADAATVIAALADKADASATAAALAAKADASALAAKADSSALAAKADAATVATDLEGKADTVNGVAVVAGAVTVDAGDIPSTGGDVQGDLDGLAAVVDGKAKVFTQVYDGADWSATPTGLTADDLVIAVSTSTATGPIAPPPGIREGRIWFFRPGTPEV